jgi:hypothetical protein
MATRSSSIEQGEPLTDDAEATTVEAHFALVERYRKLKWALICVTAASLLVVGALTMNNMSKTHSLGKVEGTVELYSTINAAQPSWQIVTKERDLCTDTKGNCFHSKCCKTTGYYCFRTTDKQAKCMRSCTVGKDSPTCAVATTRVSFQEGQATTLFCFSAYTSNTGSTKPSYEKELLTQQYAKKASIFACDAFAVYSDTSASLGVDYQTIQVSDVLGDFHIAKRKETGAWINTGMFKQIWKAIGEVGTYKNFDWTVKVDPDAVFLPQRLIQRIQWIPRPKHGMFLVNCKYVDNGFFGNLEVLSAMAFSVLAANIDKCSKELPWKIGVKDGKYGPMGEDLFAEKCMEKNGVDKVEAFDISKDGACPVDRPLDQKKNKKWQPNCAQAYTSAMHPFKKPTEYFKCLDETQQLVVP